MSDISIKNVIAPNFYDVHRDIRDSKHTHYWFKGGRGSTKSSFISIEIILGMMRDPNANAVALRKVGDTLSSSVYSQLLWAIEILGVEGYWKAKTSPLELTYIPTGQKIVFRSAVNKEDARKIKSTKFVRGYCKYVWYEELDEFFGMEEIRKINQSLLRGGNDFFVFYSYNPPKEISNWVNAEVIVVRKDKFIHTSNYLEVPKEWLGEQFLIEAEELRKTNELAYRNEYMGEPTGTGGAVFTNVKIREITDEEISHFDNIADGVDFGFSVDPVCYNQNHLDKMRKKLYIFHEIYKIGMSNKDLWEEIKEMKIGSSYITADSAEPKSIAELNSYGSMRVTGAVKGPDSVKFGIRWLQNLAEIVIDPVRCPNIAREFSTYEYEKDKYGNFKSGYPDANNHSIDSVRYSRESEYRFNKTKFSNKPFIKI